MARPELKCICPHGIRPGSKKERGSLQWTCQLWIHLGQTDSNEKEYSRTQLLHTSHVWSKRASGSGNHLEIWQLGMEAQILGPMLPGSKYGPAPYWPCELEQAAHLSGSQSLHLWAEGYDGTCFEVLLRGLSRLICLNCLEQHSVKQRLLQPSDNHNANGGEFSTKPLGISDTPLGLTLVHKVCFSSGFSWLRSAWALPSAAAMDHQAHFLSHSLCPPIPIDSSLYFYFYCNCDCPVLLYHSIKFNYFFNSYMYYPTGFLDISFG